MDYLEVDAVESALVRAGNAYDIALQLAHSILLLSISTFYPSFGFWSGILP